MFKMTTDTTKFVQDVNELLADESAANARMRAQNKKASCDFDEKTNPDQKLSNDLCRLTQAELENHAEYKEKLAESLKDHHKKINQENSNDNGCGCGN